MGVKMLLLQHMQVMFFKSSGTLVVCHFPPGVWCVRERERERGREGEKGVVDDVQVHGRNRYK